MSSSTTCPPILFRRRDSDAADWLKRFDAAATELDFDEDIDRQLAMSALRGRLISADWEVWKRDPTTYSGVILNGLFYLFLNRLRPGADLVDAAVARLEQAPRALEQGRANLDPTLAAPLIVERAIGSARAGGQYVRTMLIDEGETRSRSAMRCGPPARSQAMPSTSTSRISKVCCRSARGRGSTARSATRDSCASARHSTSTLGRCATWVEPSTTASTPR